MRKMYYIRVNMTAGKTHPVRDGTVYFTVCDISADIKSPDPLTLTFISYSVRSRPKKTFQRNDGYDPCIDAR